jgi:hypothetical protein
VTDPRDVLRTAATAETLEARIEQLIDAAIWAPEDAAEILSRLPLDGTREEREERFQTQLDVWAMRQPPGADEEASSE